MRSSYMHTFNFYISRNIVTKLLDPKSRKTTNYRATAFRITSLAFWIYAQLFNLLCTSVQC